VDRCASLSPFEFLRLPVGFDIGRQLPSSLASQISSDPDFFDNLEKAYICLKNSVTRADATAPFSGKKDLNYLQSIQSASRQSLQSREAQDAFSSPEPYFGLKKNPITYDVKMRISLCEII
jgi:hypothetical protein